MKNKFWNKFIGIILCICVIVGVVIICTGNEGVENALNEDIVQNAEPVTTNSAKQVSSEEGQESSKAETHEDYEDTSEIVQLILTGDIDIDFYSQNELKYYYHPNSEDSLMDGADFAVRNGGKFGDQNVVYVHFNKNDYTIRLTSNKEQTSQIGILNGEDSQPLALQTLSDFSLSEGDVVEIQYSPEQSYIYYNGNEIEFEDDSL